MEKRFVILLIFGLLSLAGCKVSTGSAVAAKGDIICSATDSGDTQEETLFCLSMPRPALPANIEKTQPFSIQLTVRQLQKRLSESIYGRVANEQQSTQVRKKIERSRTIHFKLETYNINSPFSQFW